MTKLGAILIFALAACGGYSTEAAVQPPPPPGPPPPPPPPPPPGGNPSQGTVSAQGGTDGYGTTTFSFNPSAIAIAPAGTVTWTNENGAQHNVTFTPTTGAPANIPNFASGAAARTFPTAGTFNYQCTNHAGMTGRVVVQ